MDVKHNFLVDVIKQKKLIVINRDNLDTIGEHVKKAYPHECCGLLVGKDTGNEKKVIEIHSLTNLNSERANDRYEIDPAEYMKVDREAATRKLSIIGVYHSHPDHPSKPSEFDTSRAWEGYSYLIIAIANGQKFEVKSWIFYDSTKTFEEEEIKVDNTNEMKPDESVDLSGVKCPINFVKTKLKLEEMETGQLLEVVVDDGEPIRSVPKSLKDEGHKILKVDDLGGKYRLLIKKG